MSTTAERKRRIRQRLYKRHEVCNLKRGDLPELLVLVAQSSVTDEQRANCGVMGVLCPSDPSLQAADQSKEHPST